MRILISLPLLIAALLAGGCSTMAEKSPAIEHVTAYYKKGKFAGWPANSGMWVWGNEILAGFTLGDYWDPPKGHHIRNRQGMHFVRSLDGGKTWKFESHKGINETTMETPPGGIDFTHKDFAMLLRFEKSFTKGPSKYSFSYDRGKTWNGPYMLPKIGLGVITRTDYVVDGKDECTFMLTCCRKNSAGKTGEGRVGCVRTTDGGKTIDLISWVGENPEGFEIMPSTVRCSPTRLVTAIRVARCKDDPHIAIRRSDNNGKTWEELARIPNGGNSNPGALTRLKSGMLCMAYAYRKQRSILAVFSTDDGETWTKPAVLRDDAKNWDMGYCRSVLREDGKIVTSYYYNTRERPEMHIAATIWDPKHVYRQ